MNSFSETAFYLYGGAILLLFLPFPWLSLALFFLAVIFSLKSDPKALNILGKFKIWLPLLLIIAFHLWFRFKNSGSKGDLLPLLLNPIYIGIISRVFGLFIFIKLFLKALPVKTLLLKFKDGKRSDLARLVIISLNLLNIMKLALTQSYYHFKLKGGLKKNGFKNLYFLLLSVFFTTIHFSEEVSFNFARKFDKK